MSTKMKTLLEAVKKAKGINQPTPRPLTFNFVNTDGVTVDKVMIRPDGTYRLPPVDDPLSQEEEERNENE